MLIVGVDLASRFSAYVGLGSSREVYFEGDSQGLSEGDFVSRLLGYASLYSSEPYTEEIWIVVEDLPHCIPYRVQVKEVSRLQGRLVHEAKYYGLFDRILFIPPATWQRSYEGVFRQGASGARDAAANLGYEPPDLLDGNERFPFQELKGKERTKIRNAAKKVMTDYVDAFLIANYIHDRIEEAGSPFVTTAQLYHSDG